MFFAKMSQKARILLTICVHVKTSTHPHSAGDLTILYTRQSDHAYNAAVQRDGLGGAGVHLIATVFKREVLQKALEPSKPKSRNFA